MIITGTSPLVPRKKNRYSPRPAGFFVTFGW